jgi:hypothetical protein
VNALPAAFSTTTVLSANVAFTRPSTVTTARSMIAPLTAPSHAIEEFCQKLDFAPRSKQASSKRVMLALPGAAVYGAGTTRPPRPHTRLIRTSAACQSVSRVQGPGFRWGELVGATLRSPGSHTPYRAPRARRYVYSAPPPLRPATRGGICECLTPTVTVALLQGTRIELTGRYTHGWSTS